MCSSDLGPRAMVAVAAAAALASAPGGSIRPRLSRTFFLDLGTALAATLGAGSVYHVLGGKISPLSGVGPDDLTIDALVKRVRTQGVREIVMATNPTLEGDGTALFISNLLANDNVKITRLARGIASGSVLEFANREMLADALRGRQSF